MRNKSAVAVLAIVLLFAVSLAIDKAFVTDEEALEQLWGDLVHAMAEEDGAGVARLFHDSMSYRGPRPMGAGERAKALAVLEDYWGLADKTRITGRREILVPGPNLGVIKVNGNVRFEYGDGAVLYKMVTEVTAVKIDEIWLVQAIATSELSPGLF